MGYLSELVRAVLVGWDILAGWAGLDFLDYRSGMGYYRIVSYGLSLRIPPRRNIDPDIPHPVDMREGVVVEGVWFCFPAGRGAPAGRISLKWIRLMGWLPACCIDSNVLMDVAIPW